MPENIKENEAYNVDLHLKLKSLKLLLRCITLVIRLVIILYDIALFIGLFVFIVLNNDINVSWVRIFEIVL